ncbi:MAG: TIR domain-containing protein, partial [Caulobacteraceae bacterium]
MPDIFLSYSREDQATARRFAEALEAGGLSVWWDTTLRAGEAYDEVTESALKTAKAVVVLWSKTSVDSRWVRAEATLADRNKTLVPAMIEPCERPIMFELTQTAELAHWDGAPSDKAWQAFLADVRRFVEARGGAEGPAASRQPRPAQAAAPKSSKPSICVLPFANMSGDAEQEYFSDGVSEDIITDLSKVSALSVTARNTAFTFKGKHVDVPQVARQLGVTHVLEGSVRKAGNRVRITAQLIDGKAGDHVWADRFDRELDDIFALQDEISQAIVAALKLKLLPEEKKAIERRGTDNADAYNLYLMARQEYVSAPIGGPRRQQAVIRLCRRATELDPGYARAWALMSLSQAAYHMEANYGEDGLMAAEKALELDPDLAEAHALKASILYQSGRREEAWNEIATALRLGPDSWEVNRHAGLMNYWQRKFAEATGCFSRAAELEPADASSPGMLISCYTALGDQDGVRRAAEMSLERAESMLAKDGGNGSAMGYGALALASLGRLDRVKPWMERALLIDPDHLNMRYNFACMLAVHLNDKEA